MTGPSLEIIESPYTNPRQQLCADLHLPTSAGDVELVSELVRAIALASTAGTRPVADELLVDRVMMHLVPASRGTPASTLRTSVQETLMTLASLGDLTHLSDGSWTAGPTFVVDGTSSTRPILISGAPLRQFDPATRTHVILDGHLRYLTGPIDQPVITTDQWVGPDVGQLDQWTDGILASRGLGPVPPKLFDTAAFTFYRPHQVPPMTKAAHRWRPTDESLTGRALMRIQQPPEHTRFAIAKMQEGRLLSFRQINQDDAQRLMFGLDQKYQRIGKLTEARVDNSVTLSLDRPAPYRETRLLVVQASAFSSGRWTVPVSAMPSAIEILGELGIERGASRKQR